MSFPLSPPDAVSHSFSPSFLLSLFCVWLSFSLPVSFHVSPGDPKIGHLITHDPLGNTMAGKWGVGGGLNEWGDGRREDWKERRRGKGKGEWICPLFSFLSLPLYFSFFPSAKRYFFFQSFKSSPLPHILLSSISLRWRWLCLCISDIKSTAVPWLLARVNPAHSHLKIKWPYIYAAQIIGLSFGLVWSGNGQDIGFHRFA